MSRHDEWVEQDNWRRNERLERDEHREPHRRPRYSAGVVQPPVKNGGAR